MLWKKQPSVALSARLRRPSLDQYSIILDTTISPVRSIHAFSSRRRSPRKESITASRIHFETIGKAKGCCERHFVDNG